MVDEVRSIQVSRMIRQRSTVSPIHSSPGFVHTLPGYEGDILSTTRRSAVNGDAMLEGLLAAEYQTRTLPGLCTGIGETDKTACQSCENEQEGQGVKEG